MAKGGGVPGMAVAAATAGLFLIFVGVKNVSIVDGLREIVRGRIPTGKPPVPATLPEHLRPTDFDRADDGGQFGGGNGGGSATGNARIADAARKYLGTPYVWGGHAPGGFDCSGLVTYVLAHDIGLTNLPSQTHTVTGLFLVWNKGSSVVKREQTSAGDLVCWSGHIGIAVDGENMIHAPTAGEVVKISRIWWAPAPVIRRVHLPVRGGGGGQEAI